MWVIPSIIVTQNDVFVLDKDNFTKNNQISPKEELVIPDIDVKYYYKTSLSKQFTSLNFPVD